MNTAEPSRVRRLAEAVPVTYMIFDLMHLDGHSALEIPYAERRRLLEGLRAGRAALGDAASESGGGAAVLKAAREAGSRASSPNASTARTGRGARPELAQGEELPHPVGRDRGLGASARATSRATSGRCLLGIPSGGGLRLRGPGRHRLQCRRSAPRSRAAMAGIAPQGLTFRWRRAAGGGDWGDLGRAGARWRGALQRVDPFGPPAPARLARPSPGPEPGGGRR